MAEGWHPRFKGNIEGRDVELDQYEPTGELRVNTTQAMDETTEGSYDEGSTVFPSVINEGDAITIEGVDADDLERNLVESGFSEKGAKDITRLVRI